jgi:hypothetical protein
VQSYVDIEGTIVWTQEYLRYRVELCPHAVAIDRVYRQIAGQGVAPGCGTPSSVVFPPRNEPYDFRVQLEAAYRDALRRQPTTTYVDPEGDIVWTQEYLRYRVEGCGHSESVQKVFDQIQGRGVQPSCGGFGGTWRGEYAVRSCSVDGYFSRSTCDQTFPFGTRLPIRAELTQGGSGVTGTVFLGQIPSGVQGYVSNSVLYLEGRGTYQDLATQIRDWQTRTAGNSMTGSFRFTLSVPDFRSNVYIVADIVTMAKVAADDGGAVLVGQGPRFSDFLLMPPE